MKLIIKIMAVWGIIAALCIVFMILKNIMLPSGGIRYSYPDDPRYQQSTWNPTNQVPLSPNEAVVNAIKYLNSQRPTPAQWEARKVSLTKMFHEPTWYYDVSLIDTTSDDEWREFVRVLLNGEVMEPKEVKRY